MDSFQRYSASYSRGCGALLVNARGEVLLLLRGQRSRNDCDQWSQPGGAVEHGQDLQANVTREVVEELGVSVEIGRLLTATYHADTRREWIAYSYLAHISDGMPRLQEPQRHLDLRWFSLSGLPGNLNAVTRESIAAYVSSRTVRTTRGLLVFDMDGTLLPGTTANLELARVAGATALVSALEKAYLAGHIDSHEYAEQVLSLYGCLTPASVAEAVETSPKLAGLEELVAWAHSHGIGTAIVTTGPEFFAARLRERYRIDHVIGAQFPLFEGPLALARCRLLSSCDKPAHVLALCARLGLARERCVAIGDSLSDVPLFGQIASSIALNYSPQLEGFAKYYLRTELAQDLIPAICASLTLYEEEATLG